MSNLKIIREKFGLSQQQVAHWMGISRSLVQFYETGARGLPTHALLQLAKLERMLMEFENNNSGVVNGSADKGSMGEVEIASGSTNYVNTKHGDGAIQPAHSLEYLDAITLKDPGNGNDETHPSMIGKMEMAARLRSQLIIAKSRHQVLRQQMQLANGLLEKCDETTSEKEKLWLQMIQSNIACKLGKVDETKQMPLLAKIVSIQLQDAMMKLVRW